MLSGDATDSSPGSPQLSSGTAKFDLALFMAEIGQGLMGAFEYDTNLFDAMTVTRMTAHFTRLLRRLRSSLSGTYWKFRFCRRIKKTSRDHIPSFHETYASDQFSFELNQ